MKRAGYKWLLRLVGGAVMILIILKIDRNAMSRVLREANWLCVIAAGLLFALHLWVKAVRWNCILAHSGIRTSQFNTLKAYSTGALLGTVTPGRIGEFAKAAFIRKWSPETSLGTAFGTIVLDRIIDVSAFALVALWGAVWVAMPDGYRIWSEVVVAMLLCLGAFTGLFLWRRLYASTPGMRFRSYIRRILGSGAGDFYRVLKLAGRRCALPIAGWTILAYGLFFTQFFLLAKSMQSELPFPVLTWGISLASLGAILPLSISGIGVRDFILIAVFSWWSELPARTVAISLTYLAMIYAVIPLMGIWPLLRGNLDFRTVMPGRGNAR